MSDIVKIEEVKNVIIPLRGLEVILASEVAKLYGLETKVINQAVKNNPEKFPKGFVYELTKEEWEFLRSKILTLENKPGKGHYPKYLPKAFTEKGLYMLATILKSPIATQTTIAIVETFAQVRELKREIHEMHDEKDKNKQLSRIEKIGHIIADLMSPDLQTSETESSMEVNIFIGKFKHTVKRTRRPELRDKLADIAGRLLDRGYSEDEIKEILK